MIAKFEDIEHLDRFISTELKHDKTKLYSLKKATFKQADAFSFTLPNEHTKDEEIKSIGSKINPDTNILQVKSVINTTNLLDSHGDVHMKGLWKKSLSENKGIYLLQEHKQSFANIISDDVTPTTKNLTWKSLGYDFEGSTQALVFDSLIPKTKYNELMFDMYLNGRVKNHSVGMQYVKIAFCVNSTDSYWKEEKDNFDKYINEVANKEDAMQAGNFWAVLEAKVIEGSAVLRGSNTITPTLQTSEVKEITEADIVTSTKIEPSQDTQTIDVAKLATLNIFHTKIKN